MKKIYCVLLLTLLGLSILCACKNGDENKLYRKINAEEAYKMIKSEKNFVILDVRTESEYDSGHIENAVLIPLNELADKAQRRFHDKGAKILVYCRSGVRSQNAAEKLSSLGYTNVYDFGGIIDWQYETVK